MLLLFAVSSSSFKNSRVDAGKAGLDDGFSSLDGRNKGEGRVILRARTKLMANGSAPCQFMLKGQVGKSRCVMQASDYALSDRKQD